MRVARTMVGLVLVVACAPVSDTAPEAAAGPEPADAYR